VIEIGVLLELVFLISVEVGGTALGVEVGAVAAAFVSVTVGAVVVAVVVVGLADGAELGTELDAAVGTVHPDLTTKNLWKALDSLMNCRSTPPRNRSATPLAVNTDLGSTTSSCKERLWCSVPSLSNVTEVITNSDFFHSATTSADVLCFQTKPIVNFNEITRSTGESFSCKWKNARDSPTRLTFLLGWPLVNGSTK
jgi:hypothetical protein